MLHYAAILQRPVIIKIKKTKTFFYVLLILICGSVPFLLISAGLVELKNFEGVLGEVFLAAGTIPVLLSLPLTSAKVFALGTSHEKFCNSLNRTCFNDVASFLAYLFYVSCVVVGVFLLHNNAKAENQSFPKVLAGVLCEIFFEVTIINSISQLTGVEAVTSDEANAFLTAAEHKQLTRSGTLDAPYALPVDLALEGDYHNALAWHFPDEISNAFRHRRAREELAEKFVDSAESTAVASADLLNSCPAGWDSPFYVAALGRCQVKLLGKELISGLLTCLSGAAQHNNRYIVQSAITSFGSLYFETGNLKISAYLFKVWMTHEISNVRDYCVVAIRAIRHELLCSFLHDMVHVAQLATTTATRAYFQSAGFNTAPLDCSELVQLLPHLSASEEVRIMALTKACVLLSSFNNNNNNNSSSSNSESQLLSSQEAVPSQSEQAEQAAEQVAGKELAEHQPTLIVCPTSTLYQWWEEIDRFAGDQLSVLVLYTGRKGVTVEHIRAHDVVLTTYPVLEYDFRKVVNANKVECPHCSKKYLPASLTIHLKYFCGPDAVRTARLAKREKKNKQAVQKAMDTLHIGTSSSSSSSTPSTHSDVSAIKSYATPTPTNIYRELMTASGRSPLSMFDKAPTPSQPSPTGGESRRKVSEDSAPSSTASSLSVNLRQGQTEPLKDQNTTAPEQFTLQKLLPQGIPSSASPSLSASRPPELQQLNLTTIIHQPDDPNKCKVPNRAAKRKPSSPRKLKIKLRDKRPEASHSETNTTSASSPNPATPATPAAVSWASMTPELLQLSSSSSSSSRSSSSSGVVLNANASSSSSIIRSDIISEVSKAISKDKNVRKRPRRSSSSSSGPDHSNNNSSSSSSRGKKARRSSSLTSGAAARAAAAGVGTAPNTLLPQSSLGRNDSTSSTSSTRSGVEADFDVDQSLYEGQVDLRSSLLHSLKWRRIVLDEAHKIKGRTTSTAKAVLALQSQFRWCLSGTPLQNRVGELYSLVRFLRMDPFSHYCCSVKDCTCSTFQWNFGGGHQMCSICQHAGTRHYSYFNRHVTNPIKRYGSVGDGRKALLTLKTEILEQIMLRRTKQEKSEQLKLPPLKVNVEYLKLNASEEDFYKCVYQNSRSRFDTYVDKGSLLHNYAHIFDLLARLRQAVNHPYLVVHGHTTKEKERLHGISPIASSASGNSDVCGVCHQDITSDQPMGVSMCRHTFHSSCVLQYQKDVAKEQAESGSEASPSVTERKRKQLQEPGWSDLDSEEDLGVDDENEDEEEEKGSSSSSCSVACPVCYLPLEVAVGVRGAENSIGEHQEGGEDQTDGEKCVVCMENPMDAVFLECGHMYTCMDCTKKLKSRNCPVCRQPIKKVIKYQRPAGTAAASTLEPLKFGRKSILQNIDLSNFASSTKIDALVSAIKKMVVASDSNKAVVFSQYTAMLELCEWALQKEGIKVVKFLGSMPMKQRRIALKTFTSQPQLKVVLMSLKAGGEGLNLQVASFVYILDPWWNPATELQAIQRTHRIGQTKSVTAVKFITKNTIEERMGQLQEKKGLVFDGTINSDARALTSLSVEDLRFLFKN